MAYPDFSQLFHLYTDASQFALRYILGQNINSKETVLAYGGRKLNKAETHYSKTESEALAVVDGIKHYQPYLSGAKFYFHTDHNSLSWLMCIKDPTGRLARWALQLQQYDFEIMHRSGSANANADALSRHTHHVDALSSADITEISLPVTVLDQPCPSTQTLKDNSKLVLCYCLLIPIMLMIMEFFFIYGTLVVDGLNHCVNRLLFQLLIATKSLSHVMTMSLQVISVFLRHMTKFARHV